MHIILLCQTDPKIKILHLYVTDTLQPHHVHIFFFLFYLVWYVMQIYIEANFLNLLPKTKDVYWRPCKNEGMRSVASSECINHYTNNKNYHEILYLQCNKKLIVILFMKILFTGALNNNKYIVNINKKIILGILDAFQILIPVYFKLTHLSYFSLCNRLEQYI